MAEDFVGGPVQVSAQWNRLRGHAYGLRGPVLLGAIRWPLQQAWNTAALGRILVLEGGLKPADVDRCLSGGLDMQAFLSLVSALERVAQSPVTQPGVSLAQAIRAKAWVEHRLAFPADPPHFTREVIGWLASVIGILDAKPHPRDQGAALKAAHERFDKARAQLRDEQAAVGINNARIARACGELGLPMQMLHRGLVHVGSGRNARMWMSTLTEATPALALRLASSKSLTASVLAAHGLPVPRHRRVASADEAVAAAREFGFPLVVKPDDREGGMGVHAGLTTEEQVRRCYAQAASVSPKVLAEVHVPGEDFRITVEDGRVVKAIGRRAGGVTGDGVRTVDALVAAVMAARPGARGSGSVVSLDDEARELLAERGMSARSVPVAGEFVALRRRANMSTGGTSRDVLADVHPDNARLAIRAARALRLDVAGIDLITPDISVSWMEGGAAICEVNAQPQISTEFAADVYRDMLRRMVGEPVRLRTVLVLDTSGGARSDEAVKARADALSAQGEQVLAIRSDGRWLGGERIGPAGDDPFAAAMGAELELDASAAVAAISPRQLLRSGLPWLHLDEVRGIGVPGADDVAPMRAAIALLSPHVVGAIAMDADTANAVGYRPAEGGTTPRPPGS